MQTIINVLALSSFLVSATAVGSGVYIYTNKDAIIKEVKEQVMDSILPGALTGGLSGALVPNPTQLLPSPTQAPTEALEIPSGKPALPFSPF